MAVTVTLPKDKKALSEVLESLVSDGRTFRNKEKVRWLLTMLYMQGQRDFTALDWINGTVLTEYLNQPYQDMPFRYDGLLGLYQTELGRLMQMDLRPIVSRKGLGLDGLRRASTSQIILDEMVPKDRADGLKLEILPPWLKFGHVGLGAFAEGTGKDVAIRLEVIPPWELMSIPADPALPQEMEGTMRWRMVTPSWLEKQGVKVPEEAKKDIVRGPKGRSPGEPGGTGASMGWQPGTSFYYSRGGKNSGGGVSRDDSFQRDEGYIELTEVWVRNKSNEMERYIMKVGSVVVEDTGSHYEGEHVPMPVNHARYMDVGGFYGRGYVDQFIPLNTEVEVMLDQLFENIADLDLFGFLCIPRTAGLHREDVQEAKKGSKTLFYDPDPSNPNVLPFNLKPGNAGAFPMQVVNACLALMNNQAAQSDLFKGDAPGRVDNARGLSFLYEAANVPLTGPMESLAGALTDTYKAMLWLARDRWPESRIVEMSLLDDTLVGVEYDPVAGEVRLERASIPAPGEVSITIGSKKPVSEAQQRADLLEQLQLGLLKPMEYRVKVRELGLSIPVGNEQEWQNYRRAKLENLMLYGDGVIPGAAIVDDNDMHEVHISVLQAFMSRPEYYAARGAEGSEDKSQVWEAFDEHLAQHRAAMGTGYPEGIPYPETAAVQMQEMARQQGMTG